jgi:hypothetical protein
MLTSGTTLEALLQSEADAGNAPLTPEEQQKAAALLAALAGGDPKGYDVRPAEDEMLSALREGRLGEASQALLIRAAARFAGERPQHVLAAVTLDERRPPAIRAAAAEALTLNVRRQGALLSPAAVGSLGELAAAPGVFPDLKRKLDTLLGALRASDRDTADRLRKFRLAPEKK